MTEDKLNIEYVIEDTCEMILRRFEEDEGDVDPYTIIAIVRGLKPLLLQSKQEGAESMMIFLSTYRYSRNTQGWCLRDKEPVTRDDFEEYLKLSRVDNSLPTESTKGVENE